MQKVAIHLLRMIEEVDLIVTSPFVRSRQTAEILSEIFGDIKVVESPELVPSSPPVAFLKWLKAHGRQLRRVVVVGHEPHLGTLASYLCAGVQESFIEVKKSGVVRLETGAFSDLGPGCSRLQMLLPPKGTS